MTLPQGKGFRFRSSAEHQLPEALSMEQFQSQLHQVSPDTLAWHLRRGDLSRWFGEVLQDRDLATFIAHVERDLVHEQQLQVLRCRDDVSAAIDDRYRVMVLLGAYGSMRLGELAGAAAAAPFALHTDSTC
jgi:hypothetical protein